MTGQGFINGFGAAKAGGSGLFDPQVARAPQCNFVEQVIGALPAGSTEGQVVA